MSGRRKAAELVDLTKDDAQISTEVITLSDDDSDIINIQDNNRRKLPCRTPPQIANPTKKRAPPESPGLKCPICIESYRTIKTKGIKAVVTRCGHLFCDSCLKKAFVQNGRKCPKCRHTIPKSATSIIEVYDVC